MLAVALTLAEAGAKNPRVWFGRRDEKHPPSHPLAGLAVWSAQFCDERTNTYDISRAYLNHLEDAALLALRTTQLEHERSCYGSLAAAIAAGGSDGEAWTRSLTARDGRWHQGVAERVSRCGHELPSVDVVTRARLSLVTPEDLLAATLCDRCIEEVRGDLHPEETARELRDQLVTLGAFQVEVYRGRRDVPSLSPLHWWSASWTSRGATFCVTRRTLAELSLAATNLVLGQLLDVEKRTSEGLRDEVVKTALVAAIVAEVVGASGAEAARSILGVLRVTRDDAPPGAQRDVGAYVTGQVPDVVRRALVHRRAYASTYGARWASLTDEALEYVVHRCHLAWIRCTVPEYADVRSYLAAELTASLSGFPDRVAYLQRAIELTTATVDKRTDAELHVDCTYPLSSLPDGAHVHFCGGRWELRPVAGGDRILRPVDEPLGSDDRTCDRHATAVLVALPRSSGTTAAPTCQLVVRIAGGAAPCGFPVGSSGTHCEAHRAHIDEQRSEK